MYFRCIDGDNSYETFQYFDGTDDCTCSETVCPIASPDSVAIFTKSKDNSQKKFKDNILGFAKKNVLSMNIIYDQHYRNLIVIEVFFLWYFYFHSAFVNLSFRQTY